MPAARPASPDDKLFLNWWRDKGRGQEAADAVGAQQPMDGTWPAAILPCATNKEANEKWDHLYKTYGVNAMTTYLS